MWFLATCEWTLVTYKNIRIQTWCKNIWTPHVIRSSMVPSFCRLELSQPSYRPIKTLQVFLWNTFFALSFTMALYWKFQHARLCRVFANRVTNTIAQWLNFHQNSCYVNPMQLFLLCQNTEALVLVQLGLMAARQADEMLLNLEIFILYTHSK